MERREELAGRVVIITGGAIGIGRGMALAVARAGASVVIASRNAERGREAATELCREVGADRVVHFTADVSRASDVERLVRDTVERFGPLGGIVNNAAFVGDMKLLADEPEEVFDQVLATNVKGVFLGMKYAINQFLRQSGEGGPFAIVNIGSAVTRKTVATVGPYVASKFAVEGLTRAAAVEYSGKGIRINAIQFGVFETPLSRAYYDANPEAFKADVERHRVGRLGHSLEDAGPLAVFLLSPKSSFMTGALVALDGGFSL
jgi:NAD(P)-dependent dehydrogenase (short-subunit alcohol dehydrogenase family)